MPTTLVLGASTKPQRYSNIATERLLAAGEDVCLVGAKAGEIYGQPIHTDLDACPKAIDTVTLYLSAPRQAAYLDAIVERVQPRRIIFNPGTENPVLAQRARAAGIEVVTACTLVMIATGQYS